MVGLARVELATRSLGNCCSIHLSYSPILGMPLILYRFTTIARAFPRVGNQSGSAPTRHLAPRSQTTAPYFAALPMASLVCVAGIETVTVVPLELDVIVNAP